MALGCNDAKYLNEKMNLKEAKDDGGNAILPMPDNSFESTAVNPLSSLWCSAPVVPIAHITDACTPTSFVVGNHANECRRGNIVDGM